MNNISIIGILVSIIVVFVGGLTQRLKFYYMAIAIAVAIFLFTQSRSGFVGFIGGFSYAVYQNFTFKKLKNKATYFGLLAIALIFISLLFYKPKSSQGRTLIYELSLKMAANNWQTGIGLGRFKAVYNEYQANYFSAHSIDNEKALLADNTFYAFNDYLQWVIETGVAGFVLLSGLLFLIYKRVVQLNKTYKNKPVIVAATAGLICIGVASLFSYPMQVWPIQVLTLIFISVLFFQPLKKDEKTLQRVTIFLVRAFCIGLFLLLLFSTTALYKRRGLEKEAQNLSMLGYKKQAAEEYKKIGNRWPKAGYPGLYYAQHLYHLNKLKEALIEIAATKKYYVSNEVYQLQAKTESELGLFTEAEKSYLRTIYMVPNRMGSRFNLMNFYTQQKDTTSAIKWANSILAMPVKVPSAKTEYMQKTTKNLLETLR